MNESYHEAHPLEYDFRANNAALIGRGPGLLSGAAISLSPSPLLLPSMAAEIAKVTFRFGLIVDQVCRSLEVSPNEINAEGVSGFPRTQLYYFPCKDSFLHIFKLPIYPIFADHDVAGLGVLCPWD